MFIKEMAVCQSDETIHTHTLASQDTVVRTQERKGAGREKARKSNNRDGKYA